MGDLPEITPPPRKPSARTRWHTTLAGNPALGFVLRATIWVLGAVCVLYLVAALAIGSRWKLAFDILLGDVRPDEAHHISYLPAALLALAGYAVVPAIIGAAVGAIVAAVAMRRFTAREAREVIDKALAERTP